MPTHDFNTASISGIDEAGRGCLAGPVVVAAVTWPNHLTIPVADSKALTHLQRIVLFEQIMMNALSYAYIAIPHDVIDTINIRQATLLGMSQSYQLLSKVGAHLIIDGIDKPIDLKHAECLPKADSLIPAVSAASIIAKVVRDRMMQYYHDIYPCYAFHEHKGYGTLKHRAAIAAFGASSIHRKSFKLLATQE